MLALYEEGKHEHIIKYIIKIDYLIAVLALQKYNAQGYLQVLYKMQFIVQFVNRYCHQVTFDVKMR